MIHGNVFTFVVDSDEKRNLTYLGYFLSECGYGIEETAMDDDIETFIYFLNESCCLYLNMPETLVSIRSGFFDVHFLSIFVPDDQTKGISCRFHTVLKETIIPENNREDSRVTPDLPELVFKDTGTEFKADKDWLNEVYKRIMDMIKSDNIHYYYKGSVTTRMGDKLFVKKGK